MADRLAQIRKLDEERNKLLTEAKNEAMAAANAAIDDLNQLGFHYRLVEDSAAAPTKKGTRLPNPDKPCPICNIITDPPHDARHKLHRAQGQHKKPLTDEELKSAGLTKVS